MERIRISSSVTVIKGQLSASDTSNTFGEILGPKFSASRISSYMRLDRASRKVNIGYDLNRIENTETNLAHAFKGLLIAAMNTHEPMIIMSVPFFEHEREDYAVAVNALASHLQSIGYQPQVNIDIPVEQSSEGPSKQERYRIGIDLRATIE